MKYNRKNIRYRATHKFSNMRVKTWEGLITIHDYFYDSVVDRINLGSEEGTNRINVILNWYRKWCWVHGHYQQWLPPNDIKELSKLFLDLCETKVESGVFEILDKGVNRYEQAQDTWVKVLDKPSSKLDEYRRVYLHDEEPRFCALRKSSVWKKIEEFLTYCCVADHASFLQNLISHGILYALFSMPGRWEFDDDFRRAKGLKIKTGKIVSLFYDSDIEVLAGYVTDVLRERIASVNDVKVHNIPSEIYPLAHHSGIGSCMKELNSERFELYDILDCCSIAYIVNNDDVVQARALLWDNVIGFSKTTKIMDTIYARDSDTVAVMKKWATENGYWYKTSQSHAHREFTDGESKATIPYDARVYFPEGWSIYRGMFYECPYVDTFKTYDYGQNFLKVGNGKYELSSTEGDGDIMTENIVCCKCYEDLQEEEPWQDDDGNYYCKSCREENFSKCVRCEDWFKIDDIRYVEDTSETFCEDCYTERYFWCSHCETDHPIEEGFAIKISKNGVYKYMTFCCEDEMIDLYPDRKLCPTCNSYTNEDLVEIDGKQMCSHCVMCYTTICESCGERHLTKDMNYIYVMRNDGNTVHRTCVCSDCKDKGTGLVYKCDECSVWHHRNIDPSVNLGYEVICPKCYQWRLNEEDKAV